MGTINGSSNQFGKFAAGDVDGDGDVDIVLTQGRTYAVKVVKNNGNFSFSNGYSHFYLLESTHPTDIVLVDVDNDGDLDIVVTTFNAIYKNVHLNDGHGNFTIVDSPLPASNQLVAADFNSDGHIDLAIRGATNNVKIMKNSGTGAFVLLQNITGLSGNPVAMAPADVNGEGTIDLLVATNTNPTSVDFLQNDSAGNFTQNSPQSVLIYGVTDLATADFDNDGNIDFLDVGSDNIQPTNGNELWINNGLGSFLNNWQRSGADTTSSSLAVGDLDGNGVLDYVLGRKATTANDRLLGSGTANTAPTAPSGSTMTGSLLAPSPKAGGTFANDNAIGSIPWNTMTEAGASDGVATSTSGMTDGEISNYLKATNFYFNIPSSATVLGIKAEVLKKETNTIDATDYAVRLVKGGTIGSTDKSNVSSWPTSYAYTTYGGSTDLWGTTWTPSDINASNFGFVLSCKAVTATGGNCSIDYLRITVYYSMRDIRLSWGSGSDTQTTTKLLQYQVRVGTGSNANNIVSGATASPNWVSRLMPNGQSRTYPLKNLPCGQTYYWNVATMDTGFRKTWGTEQTFIISSSCGISFPGGGGTGGGSSGVGGGRSASFFNRSGANSGDATPQNATLSVSAWKDVNSDGKKQANEENGFKNLPITVSGSTIDGTPIFKTLLLNDKGKNSFDLPPSDTRGYSLSVNLNSDVLTGFEPTTDTATGGLILRAGKTTSFAFGFLRSDLLRYKPCLDIGKPDGTPPAKTEAANLLIRLRNSFDEPVLKGVSLTDALLSRRDFFSALQKTQCLPLATNTDDLIAALRKTFAGTLVFPLIDLPLNLRIPDSTLLYSLLSLGIHAERSTLAGPAADLSSPVTRREAISAIFDALKIPTKKIILSGDSLPLDLDKNDPLVPIYLTLQDLGILPDSFQKILGPSQGINPTEASILLARAAFRGGKISLLAPILDQSARNKIKDALKVPTFLAKLPSFVLPSCLSREPKRASTLSFIDILPGDPLSQDTADLLSYHTKNSDKKTLWLLTGTLRPTEFGVERGLSRLNLSESPSILETIRTLLVLSCLPPYTPKEAKGKTFDGSLNSKIARDRISNLPRDISFASRTLYTAQDHQRTFDLSLFTYAPELLRKEIRPPASPMTVDEASSLLASAFLRMAVLQNLLSPQAAEGEAVSIRTAILKDLLGNDDWKQPNLLIKIPFTRAMLLQFLATLTQNRTFITPSITTALPLGEIWWERVR